MPQQKDRRRAIVEAITDLANWPASAPPVVKRLLRHKRVRTVLRRLPFEAALRGLPPTVHGVVRDPDRETICVVSNSLAASGAPKVACDIAFDLLRRGVNVVVVSPTDGPYRKVLIAAGAVVIVDGEGLTGRSRTIALLRAVDVVICNTIWCLGIVDHAARDVPILWYIHEAALVTELMARHPAYGAFLASPRVVWATSALAATHVAPFRADVRVLVPGTAPLRDRALVPPPRPGAVAKFAILGGLEARKGHDLVVSAFRMLSAEDQAALEITAFGRVVDPVFADAWLRLIADIPNIRYGGSLAQEAVADTMIAMDGVLAPSRDEPHSLAIAECLSLGRLALCSKRCGIAAQLIDGVNAFVAEDSTPEDLAAMLAHALSRREAWTSIAEAGYQIYRTQLTVDRMTAEVHAEIDTILGRSDFDSRATAVAPAP